MHFTATGEAVEGDGVFDSAMESILRSNSKKSFSSLSMVSSSLRAPELGGELQKALPAGTAQAATAKELPEPDERAAAPPAESAEDGTREGATGRAESSLSSAARVAEAEKPFEEQEETWPSSTARRRRR